MGLLARNGDGDVIFGKSEMYLGNVRPDFAEEVAVKEVLSWCKSND